MKEQKETLTTERIKDTLGASYTTAEVKKFLSAAEKESEKQAPYFDCRLLKQIERLETALGR